MSLKDLDKDKLHHAYLLYGKREDMIFEVTQFSNSIGVNTENNPDFSSTHVDTLKVDVAREFRNLFTQKGYGNRKIFLLSANSILPDAQNTLLKVFEEPIENTIFFLTVPSGTQLLKTLVSRFYVIDSEREKMDTKEARKFLSLTHAGRIEFLKDFLVEDEETDAEGREIEAADSVRARAIKFLNELEVALHDHFKKDASLSGVMAEIMKARKALRFVGSPTKTILESVALSVPVK